VTYPFRVAVFALLNEKWINMLCVLTIGTGLFLIAMSLLLVYNINVVTGKLPDKFSVTAFLNDGLSKGQADSTIKKIKSNTAVKKVRYISKEEAMQELKTLLDDSDNILEGLDDNPLPASIDIKLRKDFVSGDSVEEFAKRLKAIDGIEDVRYGRELLSTIQSIGRNSETFGLALACMLSAVIVFVCYSTVKMLFYRKNSEIETLKLLGATRSFIKSPFLIEGGLLGLAGGVVGLLGILALYYLVYYRLNVYFPILQYFSAPPEILYCTPPAGLLLGITGAYIAVGKIRF
jgi:cell division transport system permease protein